MVLFSYLALPGYDRVILGMFTDFLISLKGILRNCTVFAIAINPTYFSYMKGEYIPPNFSSGINLS